MLQVRPRLSPQIGINIFSFLFWCFHWKFQLSGLNSQVWSQKIYRLLWYIICDYYGSNVRPIKKQCYWPGFKDIGELVVFIMKPLKLFKHQERENIATVSVTATAKDIPEIISFWFLAYLCIECQTLGNIVLRSSYHYLFKNIAHVRHICNFDRSCICVFVYLCICT